MISKQALLQKIWSDFRKEFSIPLEYNRISEQVALRAAFCLEMRLANKFSLNEIGAAIFYTRKDKTMFLDHSSVIHLSKSASWGHYKFIPVYQSACKYLKDYIASINETEEIENRESWNTATNEAMVREAIIERDFAVRRLSEYKERVSTLKKISVHGVLKEIKRLNGVYGSLGYQTVNLEPIHKLKKELSEL